MSTRSRTRGRFAFVVLAGWLAVPLSAFGDGAVTPVTGRKLTLKSSLTNSLRKSMTIVARDPAITVGTNGSGDDPTVHGGGVTLLSPAFGLYYNMPVEHWSLVGSAGENKGYRYRSSANFEEIRSAVVKNGVIKVRARSALLGHVLFPDPNPVDVVVNSGAQQHCMRFGGTVAFTTGVSYVATDAPPPDACP